MIPENDLENQGKQLAQAQKVFEESQKHHPQVKEKIYSIINYMPDSKKASSQKTFTSMAEEDLKILKETFIINNQYINELEEHDFKINSYMDAVLFLTYHSNNPSEIENYGRIWKDCASILAPSLLKQLDLLNEGYAVVQTIEKQGDKGKEIMLQLFERAQSHENAPCFLACTRFKKLSGVVTYYNHSDQNKAVQYAKEFIEEFSDYSTPHTNGYFAKSQCKNFQKELDRVKKIADKK